MRLNLLTLIPLLLSSAAVVPAATVFIDYAGVHGTALGASLLAPLALDGETAVDGSALDLERIVITWEGRKSPPTVRYIGLDAPALVARLLGSAEATDSPWGPAAKTKTGYAVAAAGPREAVLASAKRIGGLSLAELPPASPHLIEIQANPDDFKLGNAAKRIDRLDLHWGHNHGVRLTSHSSDNDDATWVTSYVNRRLPWLRFANALGIDDAEFPARLLKGRKAKVTGSQTTVDLDLRNQTLRDQAYVNLDQLITRQMKKYVNR